jgi:diguanylate cyclase (GGDEF)-like protein/PAS domain S-box-containing protein
MSGENEAYFEFLAENCVDILCRAGPGRVFQYVSRSSFQVLGWKPEEMTGRPVDDFIFAPDLPALIATIARNSSSGDHVGSATIRMLKKDGSATWMENRARLVRDSATGEVVEFVVVMRDISERKRLEERLFALAFTDSLTGLPNRRAFDEALEREWKRALRDGSQISLLLLDVDHFKELNDQFGHPVGDDCLRIITAVVSQAMRTTDVIARYGGEEIAIILPSTDTKGAVDAAERVQSAIAALRIAHEGNPEGGGWASASIGVATARGRDSGTMRMPEGLLLAADNALYKAKEGGRNRVAKALLGEPKTNRRGVPPLGHGQD